MDKAAQMKTAEIVAIAASAIASECESKSATVLEREQVALATWVAENLATVTPPPPPVISFGLVTVSGAGTGGGESIKPGNILLNMRKVATAVASSVLTIAGVTAQPWLAVLAAIVIWDALYSCLGIAISEHDAKVLWVMWTHRDDADCVEGRALPTLIDAHARDDGFAPLSEQQISDSLEALQRLRCIQRSAVDPGKWWLREWVRVDFT